MFHLLCQRNSNGMWHFFIYSMLPKDSVDGFIAKLTLKSQNSFQKYVFETKVLSFETTKNEALKMGRYISLHDDQVKAFKIGNETTNILFNYSVEIQTDPKILAELNKHGFGTWSSSSFNSVSM